MAEPSRIFAPDLLDGQVCVVSGAGSGLGQSDRPGAWRLGAAVVGCGRRPEPIEETAEAIPEMGGQSEAEAIDIRDEQAVEAFFDDIPRASRPVSTRWSTTRAVSS